MAKTKTKTKTKWVAALILLGVAATSIIIIWVTHKSTPGLSLHDHVELYCSDLTRELEHAADDYEKVAAALDSNQLPPDKRERIDQLLTMDGIGGGVEARGALMMDVYKRFMFCLSVTRIEEHRGDAIQLRASILDQEIRERDFDLPGVHSGMSNVDAAKDVRELAALAREVSRMLRTE